MMKGTYKIIMAATLIIVVILAIVLGLVLVLLSEIFCPLLLRQRYRPKTTLNSTIVTTTEPPQRHQEESIVPTLSSFYAQGVLHAPRNFLFPTISSKRMNFDYEMQNRNPSAPSPPFIQIQSPELGHQCSTSTCNEGYIDGSTIEQFVYISNPVYDNETNRPSMVIDTPFETPNSSPSCLEIISSSGEEDENCGLPTCSSSPSSVHLTPMKTSS